MSAYCLAYVWALITSVFVVLSDLKGETPLFDAAFYGRAHVVQQLLEHGANLEHLNQRGETPLFAAARGVRAEVVRVLLDAGADATRRNGKGRAVAEVIGGAQGREGERRAIGKLLRRR